MDTASFSENSTGLELADINFNILRNHGRENSRYIVPLQVLIIARGLTVHSVRNIHISRYSVVQQD